MPRNRRHLLVISVLTLVLISLSATPIALARPAGLPRLDGTNPITGKPVKLAAYKGKPLVLHVWASWCSECNAEAPTIANAAAHSRNITFIGIDIADHPSDAKRFYQRHGWRFLSIDDPTRTRMTSLGVPGQPSTVFVNAKGAIVSKIIGPTNPNQLARGIKLATTR